MQYENLGDTSPLDYGGYFVYRDRTGEYTEEAEVLELDEPDDEHSTYTIYQFVLDRCTYVDGVLSDNSFHSELSAWFVGDLDSIASSAGTSIVQLVAWLCSTDPIQRAMGYRAVGEYHGYENLDGYPLKGLTRLEVAERYNLT